jgi:hypothetical protein
VIACKIAPRASSRQPIMGIVSGRAGTRGVSDESCKIGGWVYNPGTWGTGRHAIQSDSSTLGRLLTTDSACGGMGWMGTQRNAIQPNDLISRARCKDTRPWALGQQLRNGLSRTIEWQWAGPHGRMHGPCDGQGRAETGNDARLPLGLFSARPIA